MRFLIAIIGTLFIMAMSGETGLSQMGIALAFVTIGSAFIYLVEFIQMSLKEDARAKARLAPSTRAHLGVDEDDVDSPEFMPF